MGSAALLCGCQLQPTAGRDWSKERAHAIHPTGSRWTPPRPQGRLVHVGDKARALGFHSKPLYWPQGGWAGGAGECTWEGLGKLPGSCREKLRLNANLEFQNLFLCSTGSCELCTFTAGGNFFSVIPYKTTPRPITSLFPGFGKGSCCLCRDHTCRVSPACHRPRPSSTGQAGWGRWCSRPLGWDSYIVLPSWRGRVRLGKRLLTSFPGCVSFFFSPDVAQRLQ